jgi:uncharacterized OB-fold protein
MAEEAKDVLSIVTPVRLEYSYTPGRASQRFLRAIAQGRLMGQRCPECRKVYVPPRGSCPRCGVATREEVAVSDKGTVTTFCIVRVPSAAIQIDLPYAAAQILLDGADIPFGALLQECRPDDLRMGMRVQAVWVPEAELGPTFESIRYFRPIDEPDVPFEKFKEHL